MGRETRHGGAHAYTIRHTSYVPTPIYPRKNEETTNMKGKVSMSGRKQAALHAHLEASKKTNKGMTQSKQVKGK